jgi:hypothetical protein
MAIPLIHTHPALPHDRGDGGHPHPSLTHTVFSADLPDEYDHHQKDFTSDAHSSEVADPLPVMSHPDLSHPEVGFSVLTPSTDRKISKAYVPSFVFWIFPIVPTPAIHSLTQRAPVEPPSFILLSSSLSFRAPPPLTIS